MGKEKSHFLAVESLNLSMEILMGFFLGPVLPDRKCKWDHPWRVHSAATTTSYVAAYERPSPLDHTIDNLICSYSIVMLKSVIHTVFFPGVGSVFRVAFGTAGCGQCFAFSPIGTVDILE